MYEDLRYSTEKNSMFFLTLLPGQPFYNLGQIWVLQLTVG